MVSHAWISPAGMGKVENGNMAFDAILPLVLFVVVSTITPGGATTLATASGAQFGFRRSVPLIAGIAAGLASIPFI